MVWKITTFLAAGLLVVATVLAIIFGAKLGDSNNKKEEEKEIALAQQEDRLLKEFQLEREKTEVTYKADDFFGRFELKYPVIWFSNVRADQGAKEELSILIDPSIVTYDENAKYNFAAFHITIISDTFEDVTKNLQKKIGNLKLSNVKVTDYVLSDINGKYCEATYADYDVQSSFIVIPYRDKTMIVATDDKTKYLSQFNKIVESLKIYP